VHASFRARPLASAALAQGPQDVDEGCDACPGSTFLQQATRAVVRTLALALCQPCGPLRPNCTASLHLAFRLAAIHHRTVVLEPCRQAAVGRISGGCPRVVRWGKTAAIPLPPVSQTVAGEAGSVPHHGHAPAPSLGKRVFLHHGRRPLAFAWIYQGLLELLRYRPLLGAWTSCLCCRSSALRILDLSLSSDPGNAWLAGHSESLADAELLALSGHRPRPKRRGIGASVLGRHGRIAGLVSLD